jgi:hypothetical protein
MLFKKFENLQKKVLPKISEKIEMSLKTPMSKGHPCSFGLNNAV